MYRYGKKINYTFKILMAGEGDVGKTTMLIKYVDGRFVENFQMTIGVGFHTKVISIINGQTTSNYQLTLWDFGGQDRFRNLLKDYICGGMGAVLVFDLSRLITLQHIKEWVELLRMEAQIPIILVGSKADMVTPDILESDFSQLVEEYNFLDYIITSSKTGDNVDLVFKTLLNKIIELECIT